MSHDMLLLFQFYIVKFQLKDRKTAQTKEDGELLSALKGALQKIDDANGFSSDDDSLDASNDDW